MATLIICPACAARYQIKAAFPPEGRKVRCAKCGHVWQAQPAKAAAAPAQPAAAPQPAAPVPPRPAAAPAAAPKAPPQPAAAPPPPVPPAAPQAAPIPPQAPPPVAPPPEVPPQVPPGAVPAGFPPAAEAGPAVPPSPPEPEVGAKGGLFGKLMGKTKPAAEAPPPDVAPPPDIPPPLDQVPPAGPSAADAGFDDASFPGIDSDPAAADANLAAEAFGESLATAGAEPKKKKPPVVAIGWGILGVIVLGVLGMFFLAPQTTVSILPGASHLYSALGMQAGAQGLQFEGVRYGWTNAGGQNVLEVQGSVRNTSSGAMSVPTVIIVLRDENGEEISEWTTEVGASELGPDEDAPFLKQIPAPPSNVRSLKVRFAKAG
ncbi:MAG: zinc-ribbon domain-containing protein [Pseudomonadota bacterium]